MLAVELKKVNKTLGKRKVLDDVTFNTEHGEIFGLLGPNGAGKTTLIKNITSIMKPDSGEIVLSGDNIAKNFKKAISHVGALIENPALYPNMSGYDNLKVFAILSNVNKQRINEVSEIVGLKDSINRKVREYSLGMKQRLGIAISLLNNPDILILDEPTNGLDPQGISDMRNYLKELAQAQNISVIVSSHILTEMYLMCDRFAIMNKGKVIKLISKNDPLYSIGNNTYHFDISDTEKACRILSHKVKVCIDQEKLLAECEREQIPQLVKLLTSENIDIYGIQPTGNPLEKLYFDILNRNTEGGL